MRPRLRRLRCLAFPIGGARDAQRTRERSAAGRRCSEPHLRPSKKSARARSLPRSTTTSRGCSARSGGAVLYGFLASTGTNLPTPKACRAQEEDRAGIGRVKYGQFMRSRDQREGVDHPLVRILRKMRISAPGSVRRRASLDCCPPPGQSRRTLPQMALRRRRASRSSPRPVAKA